MTARSTWKNYERKVAKDLSGVRVPVTGLDRNGADVLTPTYAVQVKLRAVLPAWLWAWMGGIVNTARTTGRTGVLVLKRPGQRTDDALVVMTMRDWVQHQGEAIRIVDESNHGEPLVVEQGYRLIEEHEPSDAERASGIVKKRVYVRER